MSKYKAMILKLVSDKELKSTNQILKEVEKLSGKVVNWHMVQSVDGATSGGRDRKDTDKARFFLEKENLGRLMLFLAGLQSGDILKASSTTKGTGDIVKHIRKVYQLV